MAGDVLSSSEILRHVLGGMGGGFAANPNVDMFAGSMLSRGGAMAGPLLQGGLGMMGWDPMSLGLGAASSAFKGGMGLAGAGAMGLGVAGAAAIPMMAGQYVGGQMFEGAQQQQALQSTLRSSYRFMGANGQGFNRSQMGDIGGALREMTHQFGPGGEMASYTELTRMAGQMGQMGGGRGVRDVQDFTKRFKELVDTAKTMAHDLNTTLEGAVQAMQSMKNSGVFKMSEQSRFTSVARNMSLSGNLSMTELTAMGSIGSQISRSVGGTGRQGAFAGIKAIGNIGAATQIGALSEEDLYNATGLTGAEGRQAYATNMLSADASFLKSSRGRRLLAAMAGKDGKLDENAAAEFASGGFSVGRTMQLDQQQLSKVGRANFIRNEGRLRGAVLERFGGNVNVMSLMGWANGKGIDINDMSDRSMLFAQRQLGMGRDEFEGALKIAQNLPSIMREQEYQKSNDQYLQKKSDFLKTHGVEGVKTRFNQARESINAKLQELGANMLESGEDMVERFMNEASGVYVRHVSASAEKSFRAAMEGGDMSSFRRDFGIGPGGKLSQGLSSNTSMVDDPLAYSLKKGLGSLLGAKSMSDQLGGIGYDMSKTSVSKVASMQAAAASNAGLKTEDLQLGVANKGWAANFFAAGGAGLSLQDQLGKFTEFAYRESKAGNKDAGALLARLQSASTGEERMKIMNAVSHGSVGTGLVGDGIDANNSFALASGTYFSEGERRDAYYKAFTGEDGPSVLQQATAGRGGLSGAMKGAVAGGLMGAGILAIPGALMGGVAGGLGLMPGTGGGGNEKDYYRSKGMKSVLASDELGDDLRKGVGGTFSERQAVIEKLQKQMVAGQASGASGFLQSPIAQGENEARARALLGLQAIDMNLDTMAEPDAQRKLEELKLTKMDGKTAIETIRAMKDADKGLAGQGAKEARQEYAKRLNVDGASTIQKFQNMNIAKFENGQVSLISNKIGPSTAMDSKVDATMLKMAEAAQAGSTATESGLENAVTKYHDLAVAAQNMPIEEARATAAKMRAAGLGKEAAMYDSVASGKDKIKKSLAKTGGKVTANVLDSSLHLNMSDDDKKAYDKALAAGKTDDALGIAMSAADKSGVTGDINKATLGTIIRGGKMMGVEDKLTALNKMGQGEAHTAAAAKDKLDNDKASNPLLDEIAKTLANIDKTNAAMLKKMPASPPTAASITELATAIADKKD